MQQLINRFVCTGTFFDSDISFISQFINDYAQILWTLRCLGSYIGACDMDSANAKSSSNSNGTTTEQGSTGPAGPTEHLNTQEFLQTGRTGRRNALPDILNEQHAHVATADLAAKMQSLSTGAEPGTSGNSTAGSGGDYQCPGPSSASD